MAMMVVGSQFSLLRRQIVSNESKNAILEQAIGIYNAKHCKDFNDIPTLSN